jgi:hypothetical protein
MFISAVLMIAGSAAGQTSGSDSSHSSVHPGLTIQANIDSALVTVDGVRVGFTPLTVDSLGAGKHILRLQQPDLLNWFATDITDTIQSPPAGESRILHYTFDRRAFIISQPFGAEVYLGDSLCGTTPLLMARQQLPTHPIISVRKVGYDTVTADLMNANRGVISLLLSPRWQRETGNGLVLDESESSSSKSFRLYVTGASAVLSGIAAAYLKVKADDRFLDYTNTGDPSLLAQTHRLDTASGIALGITQVCFGIFTYFLLSE